MSENDGIYFLNWSTPKVANTSGQIDKPAAYDESLGAIILHGKGKHGEMAERYALKMKMHYDLVKQSAPETTALIISNRGNSKSAISMLKRIRREQLEEEALAKKKKQYLG